MLALPSFFNPLPTYTHTHTNLDKKVRRIKSPLSPVFCLRQHQTADTLEEKQKQKSLCEVIHYLSRLGLLHGDIYIHSIYLNGYDKERLFICTWQIGSWSPEQISDLPKSNTGNLWHEQICWVLLHCINSRSVLFLIGHNCNVLNLIPKKQRYGITTLEFIVHMNYSKACRELARVRRCKKVRIIHHKMCFVNLTRLDLVATDIPALSWQHIL